MISLNMANAASAYSKTMSNNFVANNNASVSSALTQNMTYGFKDALEIATASYAGFAVADQALSKVKINGQKKGLGTLISETTKSVFDTLKKSENVSAKTLVNQANVTDVVTAISNAEIAVQTMGTVRDKLLVAHADIMKMQL